ncbi:MAG: tyrosine-type recombinase/integrase [Gammaproteobacteria bacterium]|nr:tyrosine-type recombinase/integrase [Gammaproteobacteria bacterium]
MNIDLINGEADGNLTKGQISQIIEKTTSNHSFSEIVFYRRLLTQVSQVALENYGWKIAPIPQLYTLKHERSRFTPKSGYLWNRYDDLLSIFKNLILILDEDDIKSRTALFFLSMIMFDGVLNKTLLINFMRCGFNDIHKDNHIFSVNISADPKRFSLGMTYRVFLSATSTQILRHNYLFFKSISSTDSVVNSFGYRFSNFNELWKAIKVLLSTAPANINFKINSINELFDIVLAHTSLYLPPYLADYASGRNPSFSLPQNSWDRQINNNEHSCISDQSQQIVDDTTIFDSDFAYCDYHKNNIFSNLSECMDDIEWLISQKDLINSELAIRDKVKILPETATHILQWHIYRQKRDLSQTDGISEQTYYMVGRKILSQSVEYRFETMSAFEFEDLYGLVLEGINDLFTLAEYSRIIKRFHSYLFSTLPGIPKLDFENIDSFISPDCPVNANIIGPTDYESIKELLWPSQNDTDRLGRIRYLMTIIAYRLSLRKMEVSRLRIADIKFLRTHAYLEVVNTEHGTTKSRNGVRRIPLHDLLTENELSALRDWHHVRESENEFTNGLLFTESKNETKLISEHKTFRKILRIIRHVTGDKNIKFHSLRHSFATLLLIRFESNRLPKLLDPQFDIFSNQSEDAILPARFKSLLDGTKPTRKLLYQVSKLIGHSTPFITLLHYIHFCDWILYQHLHKIQPTFNKKQLQLLLGYKETQLYKKLKASRLGSKNNEYDLEQCLSEGLVSPRLSENFQ